MLNRRAAADLFLASALSLFIELLFIRWVGSELVVFSFYRNLALIGAFLGLGVGFATYRNKQGAPWFEKFYLPLMAIVALIVVAIGRTPQIGALLSFNPNTQEMVWSQAITTTLPHTRLLIALFYAALLGIFALITVVFIPLGELVASRFAAFAPLQGYTINVLGSLVGIVIYTVVSFLGWPPAAWFLVAALGTLYFLPRAPWLRLASGAALAAVPILLTAAWPTGAQRTLWSPYYRIDVNEQYTGGSPGFQFGYDLSVNQSYHQYILNLGPEFVKEHYAQAASYFDSHLAEYNAPFEAAPSLDRVLIVGAGTGNDVAAALRAGAGHVTAVEIDPEIFRLGEELHAEHPYADPARVTQVTDDARSFFRRDRGKYDAVVFGLLDSHTLLGTVSSVRIDNFVYTRESLAEARELLTPKGVLSLSFAVPPGREWIGERLYRGLTDVFGHPPLVFIAGEPVTMFVIARDPLPATVIDDPQVRPATGYTYHPEIAPATDDWPYLYLEQPVIPDTYLVILAGVIVLSLLLVRGALPDFRQFNAHLFLMGAAFFMLETKSTTEMALLFGSTWIVNAVVIGAILLMIVLANVVVIRFRLSDERPFYALLGLSLLFNYLVPVGDFLGLEFVLRISLASVALAIPLFFAGMIFAISFSKVKSIESALGSNLIGSVLGGILEYSSLIYGVRFLYLVALALYALSALALWWAGRRGAARAA